MTVQPTSRLDDDYPTCNDSRQRRRYMFVSFDCDVSPSEFGGELEALLGFRYALFQKEKCPTTGELHYQGYLKLSQGTRMATINNACSFNISLRPIRRGTDKYCIRYCRKSESRIDGPWEFGEAPHQGSRSDLSEYASFAVGKTNLREVVMRDPGTFLRYSRGVQAIMSATAPRRTEKPVVVLLYGPPGTGKTRTVYDHFPIEDIYVKQTDDSFFDGYVGQKVFVLDDFAGRASKMTLRYLLCLLDRYPVALPVKGSTVPLLATLIYVTTNVHPKIWYDYTDRAGQWKCLSRRINQVIWCQAPGRATALHVKKFFKDWSPGCDEEAVFRSIFPPAIPGNQEEADLDENLGTQDSPIVL